MSGIIKLARMSDGKEIEFIIPITEAGFRIVDNYKGVVTWGKEVFDVNLENEKNKMAWDRWVTKKEELSLKILSSHEIQEYIQMAIDANVKTLRDELNSENEKIRRELDERTERIRRENDERTEAIRAEYKSEQAQMLSAINNLVTDMTKLVSDVRSDVRSIKSNAIDMVEINKDFKEIQKTFKEILETE